MHTIEELTAILKRTETERDAIRAEYLIPNQAHLKLLTDSGRLQVQFDRLSQNNSDFYNAKIAEINDARIRHTIAQEQQRATMNDERRVSEDLLHSVIDEKLDIIRHQVAEIRELKELLKSSDVSEQSAR